MLLYLYQSQLPAKGFPVIRDIRSTGMYLTRQGPVKGLFCCKRKSGEQALNQLHLSRLIRPSTNLSITFPLFSRGYAKRRNDC